MARGNGRAPNWLWLLRRLLARREPPREAARCDDPEVVAARTRAAAIRERLGKLMEDHHR